MPDSIDKPGRVSSAVPPAAGASAPIPLRELRANVRDAVEDLLRALLEFGHQRRPATEVQLAVDLGSSPESVGSVLELARKAGLCEAAEGSWRLTPLGREIAVRVMRAHRLIETRLARESGLRAEQWHEVAHTIEHRLSRDEVDRLADRLANPRFDPHGDPIPTREGRLPAPEGQPLLAWPVGQPAMIAHIEDEPPALFARLAALDVFAGERVVVLTSTPAGAKIAIEGHEVFLPAGLAGLVRVRALVEGESPAPAGVTRLTELKHGGAARVLTLLPGCQGSERSRLLDLGFVPGSRIERVLEGPLGASAAFRLRGTLIALRDEQARQVLIEPELS